MGLAFVVISLHVLLFLALFGLLGGFWLFRLVRLLRLRRHGARAEGMVVCAPKRSARRAAAGEAPPSGGSGGKQRVVIRFETADGRTVEVKRGLALRLAGVRPGRQVTAVYAPANPFRADIAESKALIRAHQVIIAFVGLACLLVTARSVSILIVLTVPLWAAVSWFCGWKLVEVLRLRRNGERVPGTVVWAEKSSHGHGNRCDMGFRFQTRDGRTIETSPRVKGAANRMRSGRSITVAYDPADPYRAEIIDSMHQVRVYAIVAVLAAFAAVLIVLAGLDMVDGAGRGRP